MLRFEGVDVERSDLVTGERRSVLRGVTFSVRAGEAVALVGHNGAGKSTALLAAAGLIPVSGAGDVTFEGQSVQLAARKRPQWLRRRIGITLQFPERSFFQTVVRAEIEFTSRSLRLPQDETEKGVRRALDLVGLEHGILERSPFSLSGGEKRRLAIACALAHGPSLLLLDEPEVGLDRRGVERVRRLISSFTAEGGALVAAVHDVGWALSWADRVITLRHGTVTADFAIEGAPLERIADELAEALPDRGAWARLSARAEQLGATLPLAYRDESGFLQALRERLGGGRA